MSYSKQAWAKAFRVMLNKSFTVADLVQASGISYPTASEFVTALRARPRQIRICDWAMDSYGRHSIRVFELGSEADAPRPKAKTSAERMRALKTRRQQIAVASLTQAWNQPAHELGICSPTDEVLADEGAAASAVLGAAEV